MNDDENDFPAANRLVVTCGRCGDDLTCNGDDDCSIEILDADMTIATPDVPMITYVCGEHFCEACGDCMACYGSEYCHFSNDNMHWCDMTDDYDS